MKGKDRMRHLTLLALGAVHHVAQLPSVALQKLIVCQELKLADTGSLAWS